MWNAIKRNRLSLTICFVAWLLITVGIVFETAVVIVPLALLAYWMVRAQATKEIIERHEAEAARDTHQSAVREYAHRHMEDRRQR